MRFRCLICLICLSALVCIDLEAKVVVWQNRVLPHMNIETDERVSSFPYITGDIFREICDHHFDAKSAMIDTSLIKKRRSHISHE